ncbi:outer membrane protein assembly factor BamD [Bacterioplanoides pacificum]|uniref:Outer membrane protein assembly factor BamD n=1 Tax=Bacterioplanoides pacificum TaxID=1171596 RepID=A0ABV7VUQ7_9GAMM
MKSLAPKLFGLSQSSARQLILAGLLSLLAACSSNPGKPDELTEKEYYQQATEALEDNNFLVAVEKLRELESRYPFGQYAEQAQLELIYAQYQTGDMDAVLASTERFIRLHPLHEQVDYAYYMRGLATYDLGFSFVERYLPHELARRDQQPLQDAFNYFAELLTRFPDSPYNADARARMVYLNDRMASYQLGVAQYYMKRHAYMAAANRANQIVMNYQKTSAVADALALQTEAYQLLGLDDKANQALALLSLNYPQHPQLEDGEFKSSGLIWVDRRSLLNVISFGLLDSKE